MRSFQLTQKNMKDLAERFPTPFLVASLDKIEENYEFLRKHLPRVRIFYAMKANPAVSILERLDKLGAHSDVASAGEMEFLQRMGISGEHMIYANPVKTPQGLACAAKAGVQRFTFDDESEVAKMAAAVPGAEVLVRICVVNQKALVDLNTKFGVVPQKALQLLQLAQAAGLKPGGVCFHVGSQSLSAEAYEEALLVCRRIFDDAAAIGMNLSKLDIGGGFPVPSTAELPVAPADIMDAIQRQLDRLFPDTEVWAEPGRFLCGTAVNLVTSVIGTKRRNGQEWYVLDEGLYGSFSGIIFDHWHYKMEFFQHGPLYASAFVGPSCDSIDVIESNIMAPKLAIGDTILVTDCGAYTSASATTFNGFQRAPMLVWEEQKSCRVETAVS